MSTVWEDTDGYVNLYGCALAVYLITVISYLYGIIMGCAINAHSHGNNTVDRLNATVKNDLK